MLEHLTTLRECWYSLQHESRRARAEECVVLYDNERGKGDHRHFAGAQELYKFISPDQLIEDFSADIERWNRENRRT